MPAAITHFLQAERVMEALNQKKGSEPVQRQAFLWGAQGPDFFYCHRVLPWQKGISLKEYGGKLHREKPSIFFDILREYYFLSPRDHTVLSYLYGFLCHYSLDRTAHPFIHFTTQALLKDNHNQDQKAMHHQIESALDTIMLRYEKAALPIEFNLKSTVPKNKELQTMMADLFSHVLETLYGAEIDTPLLYQATEDCRAAYGLLNDRTALKKSLIERLEKHNILRSVSCHIRPVSEGDQFDYANILNAGWAWPYDSGEKSESSFFDLYESSILESIALIESFLEREEFFKLVNEIPFV